jgi:hypothetical protein
MLFTVKELLRAGSTKWDIKDIDSMILRNLEDLCRKINALGYQPPMIASSCLRSIESQKKINPSAMGSSHLYGCAVDIADADGKLKAWCVANKAKLVECGLWMEDPASTKTWCHLQSYAPKSMSRIFKP